jgi:hypothetical protein
MQDDAGRRRARPSQLIYEKFISLQIASQPSPLPALFFLDKGPVERKRTMEAEECE